MISTPLAPTTKRPVRSRRQDERRQVLLATLVTQVQEYAHGYCTVPALSNPGDLHTVHVNHQYEPDYCTCDNHVKFHGTHCAHKDAVRLHFAARRQALRPTTPTYFYDDENADLRDPSQYAFARTVCRFDQLSLAEQEVVNSQQAASRAAFVAAFDPSAINL